MQKIELDTDDDTLNQRQVLRAINSSPISRTNMVFVFINTPDKNWCVFTTCSDERAGMPKEWEDVLMTYKELVARAL